MRMPIAVFLSASSLCRLPRFRRIVGDDNAPVCFRTPTRGTVSGSILALRAGKKPDTVDLAQSVYLHAQGAPCETPYEDYSDLLKQLS